MKKFLVVLLTMFAFNMPTYANELYEVLSEQVPDYTEYSYDEYGNDTIYLYYENDGVVMTFINNKLVSVEPYYE